MADCSSWRDQILNLEIGSKFVTTTQACRLCSPFDYVALKWRLPAYAWFERKGRIRSPHNLGAIAKPQNRVWLHPLRISEAN